MFKLLQQQQAKIAKLDQDTVRWEKLALKALVENSAWDLQAAFQMPDADMQLRVVGYSRSARYGRTSLSMFPSLVHHPPGDSILHLAVRNRRADAAAKLVAMGASPTAENDLGETVIDAVHASEEMSALFEGLVVHLPAGHNLVYERANFPRIKQDMQMDSLERQCAELAQRCERQHQINTNHLRARDHAEAKLLRAQDELVKSTKHGAHQSALRADVQEERDRADGRRQALELTCSQLKEENAQLRDMEKRWHDAERRLEAEKAERQRVEEDLQREREETERLRGELADARLRAAASSETMKDSVAAGLATSMATLKQAQVAEALLEMEIGEREREEMRR